MYHRSKTPDEPLTENRRGASGPEKKKKCNTPNGGVLVIQSNICVRAFFANISQPVETVDYFRV